MKQKRRIISYEEASLEHLDAGVCIEYPGGKKQSYRYYAVPSFLIIGAAKCGTRELITWLGQHPNLQALPKEVNFFDEVINLEAEWPRYVLNPYFQISRKKEHAINCDTFTFEKTPAYFLKKNRGTAVPKLVKQMMPSGKFIVILRNPTDRVYSHFQMSKRGTKINPAWTRKASKDFEDYIQKSGSINPKRQAIQVGHYAKHLASWLEHFSREQLLVLTMEDFKQSPFDMMTKVQSFLDIPFFDYQPLAFQTDRKFWVLRGQGSKAYNPPYEPMKPETRQLLNEYYKPWNEKLMQLFPQTNFPW